MEAEQPQPLPVKEETMKDEAEVKLEIVEGGDGFVE